MKYSVMAFLLMASFLVTSAQKPFEGEIIYKINAPGGEKGNVTDVTTTRVVFANGKILADYSGSNPGRSTYLMDFDSGKMYILDRSAKTFIARNLLLDTAPAPLPKKIADYDVKPYRFINELGQMGGFLRGYATFYTAENLYFPVPLKYLPNNDLLFVYRDHILLEITCPLGNPFAVMGNGVDTSFGEIRIVATSVKPMKIDPAIMSIPSDYTKVERMNSMFYTDTAVMSDTINPVDIPPPPPNPKKPVSKPKTKTKTRVRQEIRKPE